MPTRPPGAATSAYKLLNETKLGVLLEDLASQGLELAQQSVAPAKRIKGAEVVALLKIMARQGFVFAVSGKVPNDSRVILVLRRADRPEVRRLFAAGSAVSSVRDENRQAALPPIRKGARTLNPLGKDGTWWFEKGDLILTGNDKVDEILAVIDGKRPSAEPSTPRRAGQARKWLRAGRGWLSGHGRAAAAAS